VDFSDINLAFWIPSQIFALFALITMVYAMAIAKTKTKTVFAIIIFNLFMTVSVGLLENWVLMGIFAVAIARDIVFLWREKYYPENKVLSYLTLILFLVIVVVVAAFTVDWQSSSLRLILAIGIQLMALFIVYGAWAKGVHMIRISRFAMCALVIVNHLIYQNYVAIAIEVFTICAITVFYIKFFRNKSTEGEPEDSSNVPSVQ